jgi:general secretion pathway protein G
MRTQPDPQRGFTLLEVLVVTVVLGIVSSISIISLFGALDRSKQRATIADMRAIGNAIEAYVVDNGFLPGDAGGLAALIDEMVPYSTNVLPLHDHWGHDIAYVRQSGNYSVISFGKDGIDGTDVSGAENFDYTADIVMFNGVFVAAPGQ